MSTVPKKSLGRAAALVRASETRSAIRGYLKRSKMKKTAGEILEGVLPDADLSDKKALDRMRAMLGNMAINGLVLKIEQDGRVHFQDKDLILEEEKGAEEDFLVVEEEKGAEEDRLAPKPRLEKRAYTRRGKAQDSSEEEEVVVKVTVIKRTGGIRFKLKGLVVEVHVEE